MLDSPLGPAGAGKDSAGGCGRSGGRSPWRGFGGKLVDVLALCIDHRHSSGRLPIASTLRDWAGRGYLPSRDCDLFDSVGRSEASYFGPGWCQTVAPCNLEPDGAFPRSVPKSGRELAGDRGRDIVLES